MVLSRIRAAKGFAAVDFLCAHKSPWLSLSPRRLPHGPCHPKGQRFLSATRQLNSQAENQVRNESAGQAPPTSPQPPDTQGQTLEASLEAPELDGIRDIRAYLEQWQQTNLMILDPIRDFSAGLSPEEQLARRNDTVGDYDPFIGWDTSKLSRREDLATSGDDDGTHLEPGDLVALLHQDGIFDLAIYVQSSHKRKQFYTHRGHWRIAESWNLDWVVKNFADPKLLEPIKPYFPNDRPDFHSGLEEPREGGLPRPLGAPLLDQMRAFEEEVVNFYRYNASVLDNLYELVADDEEILNVSLADLAKRCFSVDQSEIDNVLLFAVHRATRKFPFLIEKDQTSVFCDLQTIQPRRVARIIEQVITWVHEHQDFLVRSVFKSVAGGDISSDIVDLLRSKGPRSMSDHPMQSFVQKAQRMIQLSRKIRSPTVMSCVGPSHQRFEAGQGDKPMVYREVLTEQFNDNDKKIVEFLQLFSIPSVVMSTGDLRSPAAHIMRATGMYSTLGLKEASARLFLQELGVIAPWENMSLLDNTLLLPGHGLSFLGDLKWEDVKERCENNSESWTDSMQHLRKDWGDMPVYCVDDVTAQEIDDGFSLERIPGSGDTFWIHVHVANPTAFIPSNDPIIEYARSRLETTYAPERTYPIFPNSLTKEHFSLESGRPTLTFSAKMNFEGEIFDTAVTNGTIHNVVSLTHGDLRKFLNPELQESSGSLVVGGKFLEPTPGPEKEMRKELTPEDKETFSTLSRLLRGFHNQRLQNGAIDMSFPPRQPSVAIQMGHKRPNPYELQVNQGRYFVGDPIIQLRTNNKDPYHIQDDSKNDLVMLLMTLAGNVSGRFCATRNIPAVYNGTWFDPEYEAAGQNNLHRIGGKGMYDIAMPNATVSTEPIPHHMLGFDAYIKSTSPLRRFNDVIAHYQIEAALRFEAEHGRQFDAKTDMPEPDLPSAPVEASNAEDQASTSVSENTETLPSLLPYTKSALDQHIAVTAPLRARLRDVADYSSRHWACMLLFRAFYFAECELPPTFSVLIRGPRVVPRQEGLVLSGVITELGVPCSLTIAEGCIGKESIDVSSLVEAKIVAVDMADIEVRMEATRFVKGFERTGPWA